MSDEANGVSTDALLELGYYDPRRMDDALLLLSMNAITRECVRLEGDEAWLAWAVEVAKERGLHVGND